MTLPAPSPLSGGGGGGLAEADIDTIAELNAILTDADLDTSAEIVAALATKADASALTTLDNTVTAHLAENPGDGVHGITATNSEPGTPADGDVWIETP